METQLEKLSTFQLQNLLKRLEAKRATFAVLAFESRLFDAETNSKISATLQAIREQIQLVQDELYFRLGENYVYQS